MKHSSELSALAILNERHNRATLRDYMRDRWTRVARDYTAPPLDDWELKNGVKMGSQNAELNRMIIESRKDAA